MSNTNTGSFANVACAIWAVAGFAWILLDAIIRLSMLAREGIAGGLTAMQWLTLILFVLFMAYTEGYRGFQRSFSPRTAARAYYLYRHPEVAPGFFAPLFCMGFFRATAKPLWFAWLGTTLIVLLIISLRFMPQPWRSIVDCGVVVGLSWGLISFLACTWRAFSQGSYPVSPEVPDYNHNDH